MDDAGNPVSDSLSQGRRGSQSMCGHDNLPKQLADVWVSSGEESGANGVPGNVSFRSCRS